MQVFIHTSLCNVGNKSREGLFTFYETHFFSGFRSPSSGENRGGGGEKEGASSSDLSQELIR